MAATVGYQPTLTNQVRVVQQPAPHPPVIYSRMRVAQSQIRFTGRCAALSKLRFPPFGNCCKATISLRSPGKSQHSLALDEIIFNERCATRFFSNSKFARPELSRWYPTHAAKAERFVRTLNGYNLVNVRTLDGYHLVKVNSISLLILWIDSWHLIKGEQLRKDIVRRRTIGMDFKFKLERTSPGLPGH